MSPDNAGYIILAFACLAEFAGRPCCIALHTGITYKRGVEADDAVLRQVVHSFLEALQWVMLYYYRGCPSWGKGMALD